MINFACKEFSINDIIKCGLGLTRAEIIIMEFFIKNSEWTTSDDAAKKLSLDLSTVQRGVKKLFEKEILLRRQENLDDGGYVYFYQVKGKKEVRRIIMGIINNWVVNVEKGLEKW